jgi:cytochrome oxidase Cu insertion factor (SCO1/SenC/PrrC family)
MSSKKNSRGTAPLRLRPFLIVLLFILAGFGGLGIYRAFHPAPKLAEVHQATSGTPLIGGPFSLQDPQGNTRTDQEFKGKWMWVYFGYTFCPDICPTGLQAMSDALKQLGPLGEQLQPIFITVDPERDTPESLKLYHSLFHPRFVMLTGSKQQVQQAIQAYRVYAQPVKPEGATDYVIDHSSFIYLMDPEGRYVSHFSHETPAEHMVERLKPLLEKL